MEVQAGGVRAGAGGRSWAVLLLVAQALPASHTVPLEAAFQGRQQAGADRRAPSLYQIRKTRYSRETGPLMKWDEGKKTISALVHSVMLP